MISDIHGFLSDVVRGDTKYQEYLSEAMRYGGEDYWQADLFRDGCIIDALPEDFPGWDEYDEDDGLKLQWHATLFDDIAEGYVYLQTKYSKWCASRIVISLTDGATLDFLEDISA